MWIQTQRGDALLEVKHIKLLSLDNGTVIVLAKLDRETVQLGSYQKKQAEEVMNDLKWEARYQGDVYEMPERDEEERG
jgi:hypothetical protein